jgi:hypothetical protein
MIVEKSDYELANKQGVEQDKPNLSKPMYSISVPHVMRDEFKEKLILLKERTGMNQSELVRALILGCEINEVNGLAEVAIPLVVPKGG